MMSVIIKGMEMPTCCFYCEMCYQDQDSEHCITSRCAAQEHKEIFPDKSVRDDDCPLIEVPPHGRLIDADALLKKFCGHCDGYEECGTNKVRVECYDLGLINHSPTIIEAEVPDA